MPWIRTLLLSCCLLAAPVHAQWTPAWIGDWQYQTDPRSVAPKVVRMADDGRIFAFLGVGHDGQEHAALARFDEGGAFAWLRERASSSQKDARLMHDGRIAVVDQFNGNAGVRVRVYDADGAIAWEHERQAGRLAAGPRRVAVGADGGLLIPAIDGNDFIVIRYAADGQVLPTWRWSPGPENLTVDDIVATADGGAVIGGPGHRFSGGVLVVRFDAAGQVVFHDRELGDHGTTRLLSSLVSLEVDSQGDVLAAAALENAMGEVQAQIWKIAPDGARHWTRLLENPDSPTNRVMVGGFALDADGDALIVTDLGMGGPLRVLRVDSASGAVIGVGEAPLEGNPNGFAQAPNGRVLLTATHFIDSQGHVGARIAEFDAGLAPCRVADLDEEYFAAVAAGSVQGWTLAVGTLFHGGVSNDLRVLRFDADGPCDVDAIFVDGFEGAGATRWR